MRQPEKGRCADYLGFQVAQGVYISSGKKMHLCRNFSPVTSCSGSWRSSWSSQSAPLCCWQGAPPHPPPRPRSRQWPSVGGGARSAVQGAPPSHRQLPPSTRPPVHDSPIPENFLPAVVTLRCRTWSQVGEKWALSLRSDVCQAWPCDIIYTNWKLTVLSSESASLEQKSGRHPALWLLSCTITSGSCIFTGTEQPNKSPYY